MERQGGAPAAAMPSCVAEAAGCIAFPRDQERRHGHPRLKRFCAALAGAEARLHGAPANILVYAVGGRSFAYFKTSEPERWRFSFKASPDRFLELTRRAGALHFGTQLVLAVGEQLAQCRQVGLGSRFHFCSSQACEWSGEG